MLALAYRNLPSIEDVTPIDDADRACLADIRDVLARHGRLDRFGVTLLHNHFPIAEDELLVESCDDVAPTLAMAIQRSTPCSLLTSSRQLGACPTAMS